MTKKTSASQETVVVQRGLGAFAPELAAIDPAQRRPDQTVRVPVKDIDVPNDLRPGEFDAETLKTLLDTIPKRGLDIDVILRPRPAGKFELVEGKHRLEAFRRLGIPDIPAKIRTDMDDKGAAIASTLLNLARRKVHPYEEARGYKRILDSGLTQEQVAAETGRSVATIRERLKLLALPEEVGRRIGESGFTQAHAEVLVPLAAHPEALKVATKEIGAKRRWNGTPMDAGEFGSHVANVLEEKGLAVVPRGLYDADVKKKFEKETKDAPRVKVPGLRGEGVELVLGKEARRVLDRAQKEHEEKEAKRYSGDRGRGGVDKERQEQYVTQKVRKAQIEATGKAIGSVVQWGPREQRLVGLALVWQAKSLSPRQKDALLVGTGMSEKDLDNLAPWRGKQCMERLDALFAKKDRGQSFARLLVGLSLCSLEDVGNHGGENGHEPWVSVSKAWLGATPAEVRARVRKERAAKAKGKAKGARKAKGPREGDVVELSKGRPAIPILEPEPKKGKGRKQRGPQPGPPADEQRDPNDAEGDAVGEEGGNDGQ